VTKGPRYNRSRTRVKGDWCVYCGDVKQTDEHFPPVSVSVASGWVLPCCRQCNSWVGDRHPYSLLDRANLVTKKLTKKLRQLGPEWTPSEIASTFKGNLRRLMRQSCDERKSIERRLKWCPKTYLRAIAGEEVLAAILIAEPPSKGTPLRNFEAFQEGTPDVI
jgi:hypothetical protein